MAQTHGNPLKTTGTAPATTSTFPLQIMPSHNTYKYL